MALKLYNTLGKAKEEFKPINPGKVGFYACGPTVYDYAHIGNLKTFIFEDVLRRYLEYLGYEVRYIMNVTDVGHLTADDVNQADSGEDKMLKAALREKKTPEEIANFYTEKFFEDIEKLNFKKANYYPKASSHIKQIIKLIGDLINNDYAYVANGNVFFDVTKFEAYGKLSGKKLEDLQIGKRIEEHPDKKNPYDFSLWLRAPKEHLLKWESPWSIGYPGWHIECSAMSMEYLGDTLDIHTGGEDHIFPHHENEIAQSEGATGKKFCNFWIHAHFLLVDGKKMSKSKRNFYTLRDVLEKNYSPMDFRLFALSSHYRSQANFTWSSLEQSKINMQKISDWINNLEKIDQEGVENNISLEQYQKKFEKAMNDDLNTPLALSVLYELIVKTNKLIADDELGKDETKDILALWKKMNKVFGFLIKENEKIPKDVLRIATQRKQARQNKDFKKSDELRDEIEKLGYVIEDLKDNLYKIKKND